MKTKNLSLMMLVAALAGCGAGDAAAPVMQPVLLASSTFGDLAAAADSRQFLVNAYQDGLGAIALAQAALRRATNDAVRAYAQRMLAGQQQLNSDIAQLAATRGYALGSTLTEAQQADVNRLDALVPDALNIVYMSLNVEMLDADVAAALTQAARGSDLEVRYLASNALPRYDVNHGAAIRLENQLNSPVFLVTAHMSNLYEVEAAQLALQKSTNFVVREFAERMASDHGNADAALPALAQAKGITLPPQVTMALRASLDYLATFSGADFDKAYMDRQVIAHMLSVQRASDMADSAQDVDIKALGARLIPGMRAHLAIAQQVAAQLAPTYLYSAAQDATTQIRLAQLSSTMGSNADFLAFSRDLIPDVASGMPAFAALARQRGIVLPVDATAEELAAFGALMQASGNTFDQQAIGSMVTVIGRVMNRENMQSQDMTDAALADLALNSLVVTSAHLNSAMLIQSQLGSAIPAPASK